jgi:hypothetical protein
MGITVYISGLGFVSYFVKFHVLDPFRFVFNVSYFEDASYISYFEIQFVPALVYMNSCSYSCTVHTTHVARLCLCCTTLKFQLYSKFRYLFISSWGPIFFENLGVRRGNFFYHKAITIRFLSTN